MVDDLILRDMDIDRSAIELEVEKIMTDPAVEDLQKVIDESVREFESGTILKGRVVNVIADEVIMDVGYKSEGLIPLSEFDDAKEPTVGSEFEVLLDALEDDSGIILLSKRKADRIRSWQKIIAEHSEGDIVTGRVMRKIKGGLLVDIGVPVFLPASQVDIRRPGDIAAYIGREVTCKILKIDQSRHNIVVSRRKLIEEKRAKMKEKLMAEIEIGELRKGVVKNITDFGAFVDLGGIDGLLHITDMSWGRVSHPSEAVAVDQEIEVRILNVDQEKERIALGLKQKTENPWLKVPEKYPVESRVKGEVVNVTNYGAFVKLEEGVEGLVHVSEMSWTRRINHPSEVVAIGDVVEIVVLGINEEKQEISLGMKQTEANPWLMVAEKYPSGTVIQGRIRNLTNYGAFVEIEEGIDGLLHVSDMSWTKKIGHPSELFKKSDRVEVIVLSVSQDRKRIALGLKQLEGDPWQGDIPSKYHPGQIIKGKVTKLTSFGAFVELEDNLEGLLHISELADHKVESPEEIVSVGDEIEVIILRVDANERKIGLSLKRRHEGLPAEPIKATAQPKTEAPAAEMGEAQPTPQAEAAEPESSGEKDVPQDEPATGEAEDVAQDEPATGEVQDVAQDEPATGEVQDLPQDEPATGEVEDAAEPESDEEPKVSEEQPEA